MNKIDRYKEMYKNGLLTKEELNLLKKKGVLTDSELKEIIK